MANVRFLGKEAARVRVDTQKDTSHAPRGRFWVASLKKDSYIGKNKGLLNIKNKLFWYLDISPNS